MRLYQALSQFPRPATYAGKIFFITFIATHVPLLSAAIYVTLSTTPVERALPILAVILTATLVGTAGALWALHALLAPLRDTTEALQQYIEHRELPDLPKSFSDRAGILMRDTQNTLTQLDALLTFKDRMLGVISHDARGPATSILMSASTIAKQLDQSEPNVDLVRRLSQRVEDAVHYQLDIMQSVSEMARHGEGRLTLSSGRERLETVVSTVTDQLQTHAEHRGHEMVVEIDEPDLVLTTDIRKLEQILSNLLSNAIKYTPKNGQIRTSTEVSSDTVTFRVSDTGPGIPDSIRNSLFDAYSQKADASTDSIGLGLWICRAFTDAMEGTIDVETTSSSGTTFRVVFPRDVVSDPPKDLDTVR